MKAVGYLIGSGSMTLGVEAAGFDVQVVYETPEYARNAKSWQLNRADVPIRVLPLDHEDETLYHQHATAGCDSEEPLDLIYGNPPCGGVSNMGRIGLGCYNPTNACMRHWLRMVVKAQPRMILMESGFALNSERFRPLLSDLEAVLEERDYYYWTWEFWSAQVGTPQTRRRMFLCASLGPPDEKLVGLHDLMPWKPGEPAPPGTDCWRYLAPLEDVEPSPQPIVMNGCTIYHHWWDKEGEANAGVVAGNRDRLAQGYVTPRQVANFERALAESPDDPKAWAQLMSARKKEWADCPEELDQPQHFKRLQLIDQTQPVPTIVGAYKYVHPTKDRVLTMTEMGMLMGYPLNWQFHRLHPSLIAQGIPMNNARWAAERLARAVDPSRPRVWHA